jgi:murein L,D-transpeptidase YcbB/YkuD
MYKLVSVVLFAALLSGCKKEIPEVRPVPKSKTIQRDRTEGRILKIDTTLYSKFKTPVLKTFYESYGNETVWQSSQKRKIILTELSRAAAEGLSSADYQTNKLIRLEKKFRNLSNAEMVHYDLLLTYNWQKYLKHITQGKLNPKDLYKDWELQPKKTDIAVVLLHNYQSKDFSASIDSCKPQHTMYKRLKKALEIINSFPEDTLKKINSEAKIKPRDTSAVLLKIKRRLMFWKDLKPQDSLTKIYDKKTVAAIKKFQARHGLAADGIIGKGTISALNFTKNQRRNQIIVNLERWKWFQNNLEEQYIIINIPNYKLHVVKKGDTIRMHKIIVGSDKRKTPILDSKLSHAVFNPTWTVPPTIIKEDVIPATLKDRNYLADKNITVYDNKGEVVKADDWKASIAQSYRYVQSPGTYNSLGMVKIIFPNRFSVYLHDTNHPDYFDKTYRSLSSGCVRVEDPLGLVTFLLDDIQYSEDKISEILKNEEPKKVKINTPTYLHLWYWTAWSENGKLIFRDDIYHLDEDLYQKLGH